MCGRTKTKAFEYDGVIRHLLLPQLMLCEGCYRFPLFSVFVWTGKNDSSTLPVDAYFFENEGKNLLSQEYADTGEWGLNLT